MKTRNIFILNTALIHINNRIRNALRSFVDWLVRRGLSIGQLAHYCQSPPDPTGLLASAAYVSDPFLFGCQQISQPADTYSPPWFASDAYP